MDGWHIDPTTLREVVDDREALLAELESAGPVDRGWLLRVLGRGAEAAEEGERLLGAAAPDDGVWRVLLLVAHAHHWQGDHDRAAKLQDAAATLADSPGRRATTAQHVGTRLLDHGRVHEALAAFEEAVRLREALGDAATLRSSRLAATRAREVSAST